MEKILSGPFWSIQYRKVPLMNTRKLSGNCITDCRKFPMHTGRGESSHASGEGEPSFLFVTFR